MIMIKPETKPAFQLSQIQLSYMEVLLLLWDLVQSSL